VRGHNAFELNLFKHIFFSAAHRADPSIREFFKGGIGRNITIGIAFFWIINITANFTLPFFHLSLRNDVKGAFHLRSISFEEYSV